MGKRKRTTEERRKYAEENGFEDDDTNIDDNPVPRDVLDYTRERYDVQMELWNEYKITHPEATPYSLKTLKHFAEFVGLATPGRLDPEGKATIQTVRNHLRCFVSGWNLLNPKARISRDHTDSLTNHIKGPMARKLGLSTMTRPKTYLTLENYMYEEKQLWQSDGYEYVHDGYRVLISAKLKCHLFTTARVGEISESTCRRGTGKGLRYKDTVMLVAWKDGEPELRYSLKREFAKAMHDKEQQRPTHILYELLPDQLLVVNPILFMLAIFIAAGAFKRYKTAKEVLDVRPPPGHGYWELEWDDDVLDLPVFPEMSVGGPTSKIQSASSFSTQITAIALRAGMERPPTIHSSRRESIIQATSNGYSKEELMKFAAHTNQMTMTRDYLSSITVVDGQASFLKLPVRGDQTEDFRSMTVKRNPELLLSLPARTQDELRRREDYVTIIMELEDLSRELKAAALPEVSRELRSRQDQLLSQKRTLVEEELKKIRSNQDRVHPSEREGTGNYQMDKERSLFDRLCHMMPERERLSYTLFCVAPIRSQEGISAVEDLVSLLKNSSQVAYQPSLRPQHGRCPVPHCGVDLEKVHIDLRWEHVKKCSMTYQKGGNDFVEFCTICHRVVAGRTAWESHCQRHIERYELPLRCDFVKFRRAIVYAGRCMICMHNQGLLANQRLNGFWKRVSWEKHINKCFRTYVGRLKTTRMIACPKPDCSVTYESEQDLWYHLQDAHSYPPRRDEVETKKEADIFVDGGYAPASKKMRRIDAKKVVDNSEPTSPESIESDARSIWLAPTPPSPCYGLETTTSSSDSNTPLSSVFDICSPQGEFPSMASIPSPPLSFADGKSVDANQHTMSPSCSSSSSHGPDMWVQNEEGASQAEDITLSHVCYDLFQTTLTETRNGCTSEASNSGNPVDIVAARRSKTALQEHRIKESSRTTPALSTIPTELVDSEPRIDMSSVERMEGVFIESFSASSEGSHIKRAHKPSAINEGEGEDNLSSPDTSDDCVLAGTDKPVSSSSSNLMELIHPELRVQIPHIVHVDPVSAGSLSVGQSHESGVDAQGGGDQDAQAEGQEERVKRYKFISIKGHCPSSRDPNLFELLIHWPLSATEIWEPEENIHCDAPGALFAYWKSVGGRETHMEDAGLWHIASIKKHRAMGKRVQLRVSWIGSGDDSWEPEEKVEDSVWETLEEYWAKNGGREKCVRGGGGTKRRGRSRR